MEPINSGKFSSYRSKEMRELFIKDPELFSELAAGAIKEACIGKTPERTLKLKQMQWVIDSQMRKAKTPMAKLHVMERIFYDQVYGSDGLLYKLMAASTDCVRAITESNQVPMKELRLVPKG